MVLSRPKSHLSTGRRNTCAAEPLLNHLRLNPKLETRNPKQAPKFKEEKGMREPAPLCGIMAPVSNLSEFSRFFISGLFRGSNFGFRVFATAAIEHL